MSADTLHRAAAAMRERAEAATDDGIAGDAWEARPHFRGPEDHGWVVDMLPEVDGFDSRIADFQYDYDGVTARHVASWHPVVALAVADWLDEAADHFDVYEDDDLDPALRPHVCPTALEGPECSVLEQALVVARAYLKEEA